MAAFGLKRLMDTNDKEEIQKQKEQLQEKLGASKNIENLSRSRLITAGINSHKQTTLKNQFNELRRNIKEETAPTKELLEQFLNGPIEENAGMDQKFQWKQNISSGAIEEEIKQITTGMTGSKRTSDQRDSKSLEFWFTADPKRRVLQTTPTKGPAKKAKATASPQDERGENRENADKEALKTSIRAEVSETCFEDVEMKVENTSMKIHETVLAPLDKYKTVIHEELPNEKLLEGQRKWARKAIGFHNDFLQVLEVIKERFQGRIHPP